MLPKILIVEDETLLLERYSDVLGERYRIVATPSGREALRQARLQQDIDLAIVDYRLPDIPGTEVLASIKSTKPSVPVILTVAFGNEDTAVKAFRCGAIDYVKKPFDPEELTDKLEFFLSLRRVKSTCRKVALFQETKTSGSTREASDNYFRIQKTIQHLNNYYMLECTLQKAADIACMSRRHFSRNFRKLMGVSFCNYVNELRIRKAMEMMKSTTCTITTISHSVGYNDLTCFERTFKKLTGKTPSACKASETVNIHGQLSSFKKRPKKPNKKAQKAEQ